MRVINIMANKALGGTEQAFLDYNKALSLRNHDVYSVYNKNGKIKNKLTKLEGVKYFPSFFFKPSYLLIPYYYFKLKKLKADVIMLHSKKYLKLFGIIKKLLKIPMIAVCHNEKTKNLNRADYIFSITERQKNIFIKNGFDEKKIFVIPNMIENNLEFRDFYKYNSPIIFGAMGRFEEAKGFYLLIEAANILKNKGVNFKIKIAGSPQKQYQNEYERIVNLTEKYNLKNNIELCGWIGDKSAFYNSIDIFVLSSIHESFGIVLLEAMQACKPIISSLAEGPSEIFRDTKAAITFDVGDYKDLANKMIELSNELELAKKLVKNGYELLQNKYSIDVVSEKIDLIVKTIF